MTSGFTLGDLTSKKGWVRTSRDFTKWIPCPAEFPRDLHLDRESWAAESAQGWWEHSGLKYQPQNVSRLARMLATIHEYGYTHVPCHQIWVYYRGTDALPLPLHIGIWMMSGDRDEQLRSLSGANDPDVIRPAKATTFTSPLLGSGYRTLRHKKDDAGTVAAFLGFAFRSEEFETDVQAFVSTTDLRQLHKAAPDIEDFVRGMRVYYNPAEPK
jgi:hypothetical protein